MKLTTNTILLGIIALLLAVQTITKLSEDEQPGGGAVVQTPTQPAVQPQVNPAVQPVQTITPTPQQTGPTTMALYDITEADMGPMKVGQKAKQTFKVTNTGQNPLTYTSVTGDPAITVLSYPTAPIPAGGKGEIVVEYTADAAGPQSRQVHVNANTEPGHVHLVVKANVQ
jgi:hypothetical protein